jgi:hypothetical protein
LSGLQLAFGTEIVKSDMWGNERRDRVPAEPLASFALITAVVGLGLALIGPATRRLAILAGAVGGIVLMALISKLERDATLRSSGMLEVSAGFGLLLAIGLFFIAAGVAWLGGKHQRPLSSSSVPDKLPDTA